MMKMTLLAGAVALVAGIAGAEVKDFKAGFGRLSGEKLAFSAALDELASARGEPAAYGPAKTEGLDFKAGLKARSAADEAYDLDVTLANTGTAPRCVRLRFRLEVPIRDYRFWNGFLNQGNGAEDIVEGMETFFPAIAAMDAEKAIVLGLDPSYNASLVLSGCEKVDGKPMLTFVFPVYLEAGHPFSMRMTAAATKARYRWHDVVEKWYELYAKAYAPADSIHPGVLSSEASYLFWQPQNHNLDRGEKRAAAIRRIYRELPTWDWCYKPFVRGGDWSITDELSVGWRGHSKRQVDAIRANTRERLAEAAALNVAPMWYLNCCWTEYELYEKFPGILMREKPSVGGAWQQKTAKPVYCGGDSGYARIFRAALERIPKEYPDAKGIGWDSCFANSRIYEKNDGFAGTYPKAFDEKGVPFAHEAVGIAGLLDFNHAQFSGRHRMANAVNYKLVGPWMIGVRTDSGLYEGTPLQRPERLARIESLRCRLGPNKVLAWHKGAQFAFLYTHSPIWKKLKDMPEDRRNDLHRQIRDDDMLLSYYWGAAPTGGLPGENVERCVSSVHELVTLINLGWHPSPAVDAPEGILVARYGSGANTRLAVINPGYESRTVELNLPAEYWPQFPQGRKLTVEVPARQVMIAGPDFSRPAVLCEALPPAPVREIRQPTLIDFMKRCHIGTWQ